MTATYSATNKSQRSILRMFRKPLNPGGWFEIPANFSKFDPHQLIDHVSAGRHLTKDSHLQIRAASFVRRCAMRKGNIHSGGPADRSRLEAIVRERNSPQRHVLRAQIVLLTVDGEGTNAITRLLGKDKTVVWRRQARFMHQGVAGLTRDKTRPSRIPPLPAATVDRVVALTQSPPHATTHWTAPALAKAVGVSSSSVRRSGRGKGCSRIGCEASRSPTIPNSPTS
jgi:hypothetical protein